jgi:hypothetical protein
MKRNVAVVALFFTLSLMAMAHGNDKHVMGTVTRICDNSIAVETITKKSVTVDVNWFFCRLSVNFKKVLYASLHRRLDVPTFAMVPCATDRKRVYHGTRFPSVLSSFSYTAGLRHSFKELKGIGAQY